MSYSIIRVVKVKSKTNTRGSMILSLILIKKLMRKSKKIIKGNAKLEQMPLNILMD
ncbi:truncated Pre protein [Staphylococcus aureus]|nr:truncated Pre protein [Staphylococcus aureus]